MFTSRPKPILIVTILLVVLALLSATSILSGRLGAANRQPGAFTANGTAGSANGTGGNFQGGTGTGFAANGTGGGTFQGRGGGTNAFSLLRTTGLNFQVIGYITLGITILGIALALLSAYGIWKQKRWGLNLGMVIAILFLLGALPGLFSLGGRNINWLRDSITILTLVVTAPIVVFGILPSTRDSVTA
jgi:hypothetical protein